MKGKKGYKGYKNIDDLDEVDYSYKKPAEGDFKSNTLDFYSDDMAKKPVSDLFKGMKEQEVPRNTGEKRGYSREQLKISEAGSSGQKSKNRNPVKVNKEDTSNIQPIKKREDTPKQMSHRAGDRKYGGFSSKDSFNHRETKFSTTSVEKAKEENMEISKNKKELENIERRRKEQQGQKRPEGRKNQTIVARKRQRVISYIRIGTLCLIGVLLLWLTMLTFQKNSLAKEVDTLKLDNEELRGKLTEATSVQLRLQSEIDKYEAGNGTLSVESGDNALADATINSDEVGQTNNETITNANSDLPVTHTVATGDNLSAISAKYYNGDSTKYEKIKAANGLTNNEITVGQVLTIPE